MLFMLFKKFIHITYKMYLTFSVIATVISHRKGVILYELHNHSVMMLNGNLGCFLSSLISLSILTDIWWTL